MALRRRRETTPRGVLLRVDSFSKYFNASRCLTTSLVDVLPPPADRRRLLGDRAALAGAELCRSSSPERNSMRIFGLRHAEEIACGGMHV